MDFVSRACYNNDTSVLKAIAVRAMGPREHIMTSTGGRIIKAQLRKLIHARQVSGRICLSLCFTAVFVKARCDAANMDMLSCAI